MQKTACAAQTYALTGDLIFDGENFLSGQAILIRQERIQSLRPVGEIPPDTPILSIDNAVIAPGFVDLQLNGCGGVLFNDSITTRTLNTMRAVALQGGCTSFLPTLVSTTDADMLAAMQLVTRYREEYGPAPLPGLHLEGPYISKTRKGIHNEAYIRALDPKMREALCTYAREAPLLLTLAPECVDTCDIRALAAAGIIVSIGHSAATYEETKRCVRAGARSATHLFNAMSPWQSREPGVVGAIFDSPDLSCGIIADGRHSHFASVALAKQLKQELCFLITDGVAPVGTDMTEFHFCGQAVFVRDGRCVNADGTLGGSNLTMMQAVRNCVSHVGIALAEALRMASLYPARLLGQQDQIGSIRPGNYANLVLFSPVTFTMIATVDRGALHRWQ